MTQVKSLLEIDHNATSKVSDELALTFFKLNQAEETHPEDTNSYITKKLNTLASTQKLFIKIQAIGAEAKLNTSAFLMIESIIETEIQSKLWVHTIHTLFEINQRQITINDIIEAFPKGLPSQEQYIEVWKSNRVQNTNKLNMPETYGLKEFLVDQATYDLVNKRSKNERAPTSNQAAKQIQKPKFEIDIEHFANSNGLNGKLAVQQNLTAENIIELVKLHSDMNTLIGKTNAIPKNKITKIKSKLFEIEKLEFKMQKEWGFPKNRNKHTHFRRVTHCICTNTALKNSAEGKPEPEQRKNKARCPVHAS